MTEWIDLTAQPENARQALADFKKSQPQLDWSSQIAQTLIQTCGNAPYLIRFLNNHPHEIEHFFNSVSLGKQPTSDQLKDELHELIQKKGHSRNTLCQFKYRHYLRLTSCELQGVSTQIIFKQFSLLADVIVTLVAQNEWEQLKQKHKISDENFPHFALIAMGKLGSHELNYSSDIDLIGVYDFDNHELSPSPHEFYCKLFRNISKTLSEQDTQGFLYRVDWDLRPEGQSGTLANSMKAMETYYQTFGEEWERQAFVRARVLYQSSSTGDDFMQLIRPFIYRKSFDEKTIKNTWNMKAKIINHLNEKSIDGFHIKLGTGGIRDIEFFAQGFQLLLGGLKPSLQNKDTIDALRELNTLQVIEENIINNLIPAYLFLRRIENALQMENEAQVHLVKNDPTQQLRLARRLGFLDDDKTAVSLFKERLSETKAIVAKYFKDHYGGDA